MKFAQTLIALVVAIATFKASAEDIELYVNHNVELDEKPRVLIIFDTSGSMAFSTSSGNSCGFRNGLYTPCSDSRLGVAQNAISKLVTDNDDIEFGLMRFNSTDGGYVLSGIGSSQSVLRNTISALPADGGTPLAETLWEAYLYITGQNVDYGLGVLEAQRDTNIENRVNNPTTERECWWVGWGRWRERVCQDVVVNNYTYTYISPFADAVAEAKRCDNSINIIYMTDGDPSSGSDNDKDSQISALHNQHFGRYLSSDDKIHNNYLHQLAKVIHGVEANKSKDIEEVIVDLIPETKDIHETGRVFTIGFGSGMSSNGKKLLEAAAELGGGDYLHANTSEQLSEALKNTITRIREVNDTFTSPSIASNNVDQTRSRDSIYYAMFYPESGARWRGNLKKLKVIGSEIVDSDLKPALNTDGLIDTNARTFWLGSNESADGNTVQRGGVNGVLTKLASRTIYTDAGTTGLIDFTKSNVSSALGGDDKAAAVFGVNKSQLTNTINWSRGMDVDNEDKDLSWTDQREDIFGDPLHSKPVTIDYGNDDVRILIGTNAGYLHMFKDKKDVLSESWAFIPSSLYSIINPLRNNQADTKVYGVDGPISVFFDDKNNDGVVDSNDRVWVFFGLRRGGNAYYGLDITSPDQPKLMWGGPIIGGQGDFKELGQSWSKPIVSYINLKNYKNKPVLIFGAGYDTNKDNITRTDDGKGRGIYIVDASSGKKIWSLTPDSGYKGNHSIAADLSPLDSDYDGFIDRLYATDTGGNVWRVDMPSDNPTDGENPWTHFKLAELASGQPSQDRRFFYKPMIARTMFSKVTESKVGNETVVTRQDTPFDAVLIGSGNRSKPTATTVSDQLFMIRDSNTVTKSFIGRDIPAAVTTDNLMNMNTDPFGNALDNLEKFTDLEIELGSKQGWYYNLTGAGEKSLAAATVVGGVAYFTSYTPASDTATVNQCSLSGGSGGLYAFHLHYGTKVYDQLKYTTSNDVPDTPQLYYGEHTSCKDNATTCSDDDSITQSQFLLIGPGIKGSDKTTDISAKNPFVPKEIIGPGITVDEQGKIKLVNDAVPIGFGFKTQQTFIYKREVNDNQQ